MNLENWQRRELIGATSGDAIVNRYYGYTSIPTAADTDAVFSIRKVSVSGSAETARWNDNAFSNFNAKWSERAANFTAPSGALGFTYSGSNPVNFSWTRLNGVNQYDIIVKNELGFIVDKNGGFMKYIQSTPGLTERYENKTKHEQRFTQTGTYSIVLSANNAAGSLTATFSYIV